jgi:hypothetical protein
MGWTLAATQADASFPAVRFFLGFLLILIGYGCAKTRVITRPSRRRLEWLTGYQGDGPPEGGITEKNHPFTYFYVVLCMYVIGGYMILSGSFEVLFS